MGGLDSKLKQYLLTVAAIDPGELQVAVEVAIRRQEALAQALLRMELIERDLLHRHIVDALGFPLLDLDNCTVHSALAECLGELLCRQYGVVPVHPVGPNSLVDLVFSEPDNIIAVDTIRQRLGAMGFRVCMADKQAITRMLGLAFTRVNVQEVSDSAPDAVTQLEELLSLAIEQSASDVHIEPTGDCARVRFRCDGVLHCWRHISLQQWQPLVGRIKVLAGLDIADSRSPQDGRLTHASGGREVDVRVSVMPTDCGEAAVLRLLDRNRNALDFDGLGILSEQQIQLQAMLGRPEGMLLVCGPTGSGKSTTLYALVESIRGESLNILTLEDPVEYPATWVRQSSINDSVSMGYGEGVRAALRQDPDVMLIGEMRDADTAQMSLRAAMTGHRVLTTVHANSAMSSIGRLLDLGLQPSLIAGNVIGVIAQRLLRRLCVHCKSQDPTRPRCFVAVGCERCHQRGYSGRRPILEIWHLDSDFDELLHTGASRYQLEKLSAEKGHSGLKDAALALMQCGETSAEEVERVIGPVEELANG